MIADRISPAARSAVMAKIRGKDTKPEKAVRSMLHKAGYRFRLHRRDLPGTPDLTFPSRRKVILVHGCFWHQHGCRLSTRPKSNTAYWDAKLKRNQARDRANLRDLRQIGWKPYVVWECKLKDDKKLMKLIRRFLDS